MEKIFLKKGVVIAALFVAVFLALRPASLQAAMVPALNAPSGSASVNTILDNSQVMSKLATLGYSRNQVKDLLATLSPEERANLQQKVNLMRSGGDGLGLILVILLVVLIVVLITGRGHHLSIEAK